MHAVVFLNTDGSVKLVLGSGTLFDCTLALNFLRALSNEPNRYGIVPAWYDEEGNIEY